VGKSEGSCILNDYNKNCLPLIERDCFKINYRMSKNYTYLLPVAASLFARWKRGVSRRLIDNIKFGEIASCGSSENFN